MENKGENDAIPEKIGEYKIIKRLGLGGMGEVFLAIDKLCNRKVAIKCIRNDLIKHETIKRRFLKEAKITATLYHPSIIPVYSIHQSDNELYYVMPYVEGETLKTILRKVSSNDKSYNFSINFAMRIFNNICQAISYCHSMNIIHRDIKPENILIGNFGQVLIFDLGLAGYVNESEVNFKEIHITENKNPNLTRPGKVIGTLSYMSPERMDGKEPNVSTDIYSLGVILYQLLTLKMPFRRTTVKEYKKLREFEVFIEAFEAAPYLDIPMQLSEVAKKCLSYNPKDRYANMSELLIDLEKYNSGLPEWVFAGNLDINNLDDWKLQENILVSKLIAITQSTEIMQWYMIMISKKSFSGNKKIEVLIRLKKESEGVGFLLNIPHQKEQDGLDGGYLIFLGSKKHPGIILHRSHVSVRDISDAYLDDDQLYYIEIEKLDQKLRLSVDGKIVLEYVDPLPIVGTYVGLLCQDMEFTIETFRVLVGSQNAIVGCLSIPDAFLSSKNFTEALNEYERISKSFPGRVEGREALFRSGITLIEMAKVNENDQIKESLLEKALNKFQLLHQTSSEPLEYIGKSLVYKVKNDLEEEFKCLELGIRKFSNHPLVNLIEERIIFRLHESAKNDRAGVYNFALITLRHLQQRLSCRETHALIHNLYKNSEKLYMIEPPKKFPDLKTMYKHMAIELAFWINKPLILKEILLTEENPFLIENINYLLAVITKSKLNLPSISQYLKTLKHTPSSYDLRPVFFHINLQLTVKDASKLTKIFKKLNTLKLDKESKKLIDVFHIWKLLLNKEYKLANDLLNKHSKEGNENCTSPFFMLMGAYIAANYGIANALSHFEKSIDYSFPPLYSILASSLKWSEKFKENWLENAFFWEKITLYRHSILFYHSLNDKIKVDEFEKKLNSIYL